MGKSLYKDMLSMLTKASTIKPTGNHLRRLNVLAGMICSSMGTKSSSLEGLSDKESKTAKQSESHVKQSKRWLSSKWTDWETFFAPFATKMLLGLSKKGELVLVIDGSQTAGDCVTLMLSVIWHGYAIPLAWLTKKGEKGHFPEEMHLDLVAVVEKIIPVDCRIVFLGDGEFDGLKLRQCCKKLKWEFVLRTSVDRKVDCGGEVAHLGSLSPPPGSETVFLKDACDGDNAIYWLGKGYENPVLLLTNMDLGEMACDYYRRRFKIETLFKQLKSAGFGLHRSKIKSCTRVKNLIIVIAFAFIFTFCMGVLLKNEPQEMISKFARKDRVDSMRPITLAQKCISKAQNIAKIIFSNFSKSWEVIFT